MNLNKLNNRITKVSQTLDRKKTSLNRMIVAVAIFGRHITT